MPFATTLNFHRGVDDSPSFENNPCAL